jgi:hypothetical protein
MHLANEDEVVAKFKSQGLVTIELLENETVKENDELQFHGHEVTGGSFDATVDDRKPFPRIGYIFIYYYQKKIRNRIIIMLKN